MVPIDEYEHACDAIASAGSMSQISPPVNGESIITCHQQASTEKSLTPPAADGSFESAPFFSFTTPMHMTCMEVDGATGSSELLNCTMTA